MKRPSDLSIQIIVIVALALVALVVNSFAFSRLKSGERPGQAPQITGPSSAALKPQPSATFERLIPYTTTAESPGPSPTLTVTPPLLTSTPFTELTMIPPFQQTALSEFLATAMKQTRVREPTEFALATGYAMTAAYEHTKEADAPCSCTADLYDCTDFLTRTEAQVCYNYCMRIGAGDIHNLDPDGDGFACRNRDR